MFFFGRTSSCSSISCFVLRVLSPASFCGIPCDPTPLNSRDHDKYSTCLWRLGRATRPHSSSSCGAASSSAKQNRQNPAYCTARTTHRTITEPSPREGHTHTHLAISTYLTHLLSHTFVLLSAPPSLGLSTHLWLPVDLVAIHTRSHFIQNLHAKVVFSLGGLERGRIDRQLAIFGL